MDRYYIIDNKPQIFSLLTFLKSMAIEDVLDTDQVELINIIKLGVDETISYKESSIKRII
tara:strand:- start:32 stop:211 length:180 start_codon:yes stop_codon:yes gene_type:complete